MLALLSQLYLSFKYQQILCFWLSKWVPQFPCQVVSNLFICKLTGILSCPLDCKQHEGGSGIGLVWCHCIPSAHTVWHCAWPGAEAHMVGGKENIVRCWL